MSFINFSASHTVINLTSCVQDIVAKLAIVAKDDAADIALKRWQLIAAGLDKIFFVVYVISLLIVSVFFGVLALEAKYHLGSDEQQQ